MPRNKSELAPVVIAKRTVIRGKTLERQCALIRMANLYCVTLQYNSGLGMGSYVSPVYMDAALARSTFDEVNLDPLRAYEWLDQKGWKRDVRDYQRPPRLIDAAQQK